ncbi:MAG: phosphonopyruvate decarboxylase [Lachnospiraceae bacterium]|nr:phosphonopyruvate decarboxylase [Lachnospiraceae bacterium]
MKAFELLQQIEEMGIEVIAGVPDSTLKQFCDGLQLYEGFRHYVTANEGAAVGLAVGTYLASGKPACIYMQNSGIGNAVNPLASLANGDVYGIPMLFIVGWRGEPGVKDEPQHVFQGKITCKLFETMEVPYAVVDAATTREEMLAVLKEAKKHLDANRQFAMIVKKGTFEADKKFTWKNGNKLVREQVLGRLLEMTPKDACIVSTTGKISRELYEQSNRLFGNHDAIFMTVGGMGHASMIAFGIAQEKPEKKVICIDGDGAVLMHMGALAFIASHAPENYVHIVLNNQAHESVGAMPTDCGQTEFAALARAAGYAHAEKITDEAELARIQEGLSDKKGPVFYEIMVSLDSRADLSRPAETAKENRDGFMGAVIKGTPSKY